MRKRLLTALAMLLLSGIVCACSAPETGPTATPEALSGAVQLTFENHMVMKAGEMKQIDITLDTVAGEPGQLLLMANRVAEVGSAESKPLSDDLGISIAPALFTAEPDSQYVATFLVYTTDKVHHGEYAFVVDCRFQGTDAARGWITVEVE